jgi:hypothetical protein
MSLERDLRVLGANKIGPGIGDIYYLVANKTTDKYYSMLQKRRVNENRIGTVLNDVYTAMSDAQNDTAFVFPGTHTVSADLVWAKNHTHLVGVGGPLTEGDTYVDGTTITSGLSGTTSVTTLTVTGAQCQFQDALIEQGQTAATAKCALKVAGPSNYFKNFSAIGMMNTTQNTGTTSSSLEIGASASYLKFEGGTIGSPLWFDRTAVNGQILFSNTSSATLPQDITFLGTRVLNASATATNPAVRLTANNAVDRLLEFRDCTFFNFQANIGTVLTSGVFLDGCGTSHIILLSGKTCQYGWNNWADVHTYIFNATGAAAHGTGGTAIVSA